MKRIIDGAAYASKIKSRVRSRVKRLTALGFRPGLATVSVGSDPASRLYLKLKQNACEEVGIYSEHFNLSSAAKQGDVLKLIGRLNSRPEVNGILVQLPLPKKFDVYEILAGISPEKDVDGFNPANIGRLAYSDESFAPATPKGIAYLLEKTTNLEGKNVVIVNHSIVVGKPLALMLLNRNATVEVCHVHTRNLGSHTCEADILVTAVGRPNLITASMVKKGAVVIDAGISKKAGKVVGDVDFGGVQHKVKAITPVPGGVGPLTIAMLLQNTVSAAEFQYL